MSEEKEIPPPQPCHMLLESIEDNLDLFGRFAMECKDREFLTQRKNFEIYYGMLPQAEEQGYGRHYIRRIMLKVLAMLEIGNLLQSEGEAFGKEEYEGQGFPCLSLGELTSEDWATLKKNIELIQKLVIRKDALVGITNSEENDKAEARSNINPASKLLRIINLQEILSSIRNILEEHLTDESIKEWKKDIDKSLVGQFIKETEKCNDKFVKKNLLDNFLEENESTGDLDLKDLASIRKTVVLTNRPYSLQDVSAKAWKDLTRWSSIFPKGRISHLYLDNSEDEEEEEEEKKEETDLKHDTSIQSLKSSRENLKQIGGADPIHEARERANQATSTNPKALEQQKEQTAREEIVVAAATSAFQSYKRPPPRPDQVNSQLRSSAKKRHKGGQLLNKKVTATSLRFGDSDDEEMPEPDEHAVLSDLPIRKGRVKNDFTSNRKKRTKAYEGRRIWSDDEKNAIKEGIKVIGVGKWADIKRRYSVLLGDRTGGQIKDCFRTMRKRNELNDIKEYL